MTRGSLSNSESQIRPRHTLPSDYSEQPWQASSPPPLLTVLRLAKPSKLEERTFEPVREGWLVVTKLGKESPGGEFDRTEQRRRIEGKDERVLKRSQLFER